jgi:hypothetical protein
MFDVAANGLHFLLGQYGIDVRISIVSGEGVQDGR